MLNYTPSVPPSQKDSPTLTLELFNENIRFNWINGEEYNSFSVCQICYIYYVPKTLTLELFNENINFNRINHQECNSFCIVRFVTLIMSRKGNESIQFGTFWKGKWTIFLTWGDWRVSISDIKFQAWHYCQLMKRAKKMKNIHCYFQFRINSVHWEPKC